MKRVGERRPAVGLEVDPRNFQQLKVMARDQDDLAVLVGEFGGEGTEIGLQDVEDLGERARAARGQPERSSANASRKPRGT